MIKRINNFLAFFLITCYPIVCFTQNQQIEFEDKIISLFEKNTQNNFVVTNNINQTLSLNLNKDMLKYIISNKNEYFTISMPFFNDKIIFDLEPNNDFFKNLESYSTDVSGRNKIDLKPSFQSFKILYNDNSIGVLNYFDSTLQISFKIDNNQYEISKRKNNYILFNVNDLKKNHDFKCGVEESLNISNIDTTLILNNDINECIEFAVDVDYATRQTFNSEQEAINWALSIFAGISQLYEELVDLSVSVNSVNVWNIQDPYDTPILNENASDMLSEFRNYWNENNSDIERDLAHLLTKRTNTGTGGIAYVDVLCSESYGYGFSANMDNVVDFDFPNPVYTWNLMVCTHEIGHNIGANHTHSCNWSPDETLNFVGGAIDNCIDECVPSGPFPENGIGTIMSYCHIGGNGINLEFHEIVESQAIYPGINSAGCLNQCSTEGCTDSTAFNYNSSAITDDGSCCFISGCTELNAINYDISACFDDGSCIFPIYGCMDSTASNYNIDATEDDSSCCYDPYYTLFMYDSYGDGWNGNNLVLISDDNISYGPFTFFAGNSESVSFCLPDGCYNVICDGGLYQNEISWNIINVENNESLISGNSPFNQSFCNNELIGGCTDPNACNYNSNAVENDGSCVYSNYVIENVTACEQFNWNGTIYNFSGVYTNVFTNVNGCDSIVTLYLNVIQPNYSVDYQSHCNSYTWIDGITYYESNNTATFLLTNQQGCDSIVTLNLTINNGGEFISSYEDVSCYGYSDGYIDIFPLEVSNQNQLYSLYINGSLISNSLFGFEIYDLSTGQYEIEVVDENGCSYFSNFEIDEPQDIDINVISTNSVPHGICNGEASLNISGGVEPFDYYWSTGETSSSVSNLCGDQVYSVSIIDQNGCTSSSQFHIVEDECSFDIGQMLINDIACDFSTYGSIYSINSMSGGYPPYNVKLYLNNQIVFDQTQQTDLINIDNLSAGNYYLVVEDLGGCISTFNFNLTNPISPQILTENSISCFGYSDGVLSVNVNSNDPINYTWYNGLVFEENEILNIENLNFIQNLSSGTYSVVVEDSECSIERSFYLSDPNEIEISVDYIDPNCFNSADGVFNASVSGGTGDYSYNLISDENYITNQLFSSQLTSGNYTFVVNDENGCENSFDFLLSDADIITNSNNIFDASSQEECDGVVISQTSGGTPPYSYFWNGVETNYIATLCAGINSLEIIDANGCMWSEQVFVGPETLGCTDISACNYNEFATSDDGSCEYPDSIYDCLGECLNDFDQDGICDELEIFGCTDADAPNFDNDATQDDGSCIDCNITYNYYSFNASTNLVCDGILALVLDNQFDYTISMNGVELSSTFNTEVCYGNNFLLIEHDNGCNLGEFIFMDSDIIYGCMDPIANNYDSLATMPDSCTYPLLSLNSVNDTLCLGDTVIISWTGGAPNDPIFLSVNNNTTQTNQFSIVSGISNTGSFSWVVQDFPAGPGDIYQFYVQNHYPGSSSTSTWDYGNLFVICPNLGCTNPLAINYDPSATVDDGSCEYEQINDSSLCPNYEDLINNSWQWIFTNDGCPDTNLNVSEIQNLVINDLYSAQYLSDGILILEDNYGTYSLNWSLDDCNLFQDYLGYTYDVTYNQNGYYSNLGNPIDGTCLLIYNNSESVLDDDSLNNPCNITPNGLFVDNIIHNRVRFNWSEPMLYPSHYMIRYRPVGTNQWTVMTAGPVNDNEFSGTSRTRYFMDPETTYEWNIRARVLNSDGSTDCQSPWSATSEYTTLPSCPNLENLSVSTEANWVTFSADAPGEEWGVWQSKAKIRELGTNSFRYANGDASGNINVLKGNFSASTSYEWHTKSWCTGNVDVDGNSDPQYHSGWGEFSSFITEEICDKLPINLSTSSNGANTAITMSWDLPLSGTPDHYFLELNNDITGQQWQWNNIAGEQTSKTKFNLSSGDYSWRIRGACGENGTSWATIFTQPEYYTLGGDRLGVSSVINDLEIYPNPSRDIFNVEFSTDEAQEVEIIVVNSIGQEIFNERVEVEDQYIKQIDLSNYSKGIYNLSFNTNQIIRNYRLILY